MIRNGFYSALVKPNLRIISINNNFCVSSNIPVIKIVIIIITIMIIIIMSSITFVRLE